ncbi:PTS sugar transporter subunit IIA [Oscillospiraceae bacterium MB08-C2-2]|nr:PTS sugar transporter subunit IIA [Oscillospiraceae bacterium MB08-C2-2]
MIGILVVSHGALAKELVASAQMLMGEGLQLGYEGIMPEDSSECFYQRVNQLADQVDTGTGVLVLADLYGGTPCNTVALLSRQRSIRVVTGVNLPMVMAAISERTEETTLDELAELLAATGTEGIARFSI